MNKTVVNALGVIFLLLCCGLQLQAQDWNNKQCAVVLTYDDALNVHLDKALPALDSLQLKGTFFLTAAAPAFRNRMAEWKKVAENKHELANHTLFHPCIGSQPGRSFVTPDYDLATYSIRRITNELTMTNSLLQHLDGKKERTFAYPCGDMQVNDTSYVEAIKGDFVAARGVQSKLVQRKGADLYNIDSFMINGQTGDQLIAMVKQAMSSGRSIVFLFHGVGGEHGLNVALDAHSQLLQFIKENEKQIWNPTFIELAQYLKTVPAGNSKAKK